MISIHQQITEIMLDRLRVTNDVKKFSDAQDVLDHIRLNIAEPASLPDIILLDLNMPVMDGWEFLEAFSVLRGTLPKPVKVYVLTSSIDERDRQRVSSFDFVAGYPHQAAYQRYHPGAGALGVFLHENSRQALPGSTFFCFEMSHSGCAQALCFSARIISTGSFAENTVLPATSTSAPAATIASQLFSATPPSTSISASDPERVIISFACLIFS